MDLEDIREIEELQDGSTLYEIGENLDDPISPEKEGGFYRNLAVDYPEDARKKLAAFLLDAFEEDIEAREVWLEPANKAKKFLGVQLEDVDKLPFKNAVRTFDGTMLNALLRNYATVRGEMLGSKSVADFEVIGESDQALEEKGERRSNWNNYYLTVKDSGFYPDYEKFILYTLFYGTGIRKVYIDPLTTEVMSRFITPENFVIDADCSSILDSSRITHILHLSKRDILLNQQSGIYLDVELPYLKNNSSSSTEDEEFNNGESEELSNYTKRTLYPILETHVYLNLEDFTTNRNPEDTKTVPLPYIVTIDKIGKEILSIRNNWKEMDEERKRIEYFELYKTFPGFGIWGIGLAHIMGSDAISATKILNIIIDASIYKNMQGGVRVKGFKEQDNDIIITPGSWKEVDTGGVDLDKAFRPLPYTGPDPTTYDLLLRIIEQNKEKGSIAEMGMLASKEDISPGTAMINLDVQNKLQSAILRSFHFSFSRELQKIDSLFSEIIDHETFSFTSHDNEISQEDFVEDIRIIPVSDPYNNSSMQRMMKAEALLNTAMQLPDLHNMPEVLKYLYKAYNFSEDDIKSILMTPTTDEEVPPVDPLTEYMNILLGKPVRAVIWQDHQAHIVALQIFSQRPEIQQKPDALANLQALITQHETFRVLLEIQQMLGYELPPLEELQDPAIQNAIAMQVAEVLSEQQILDQEENPAPIDPNALILADIQQKQAETEARERIATQKTEADIFKAQLDFEKEKAKIESNEEIASLKSETELTKQGEQEYVE